jgi:hypothetical protein
MMTATQVAAMRDELRETELNLVQTLIAAEIGKQTKQQQIDFMRRQMERIARRNRALLAQLEPVTA